MASTKLSVPTHNVPHYSKIHRIEMYTKRANKMNPLLYEVIVARLSDMIVKNCDMEDKDMDI